MAEDRFDSDPIWCGPRPAIRDWRKLSIKNLTRAELNMKFIESYCLVPEGDHVGKPLVLAEFQQLFYYAIYDNPHITRRAFLSIARKNSKTATIAGIVIVHLVGPESIKNSNIHSGAQSRDQAAEVYNYASKMVQLSPQLGNIVRPVPSKKMLIGLLMNTTYTARAAEAKRAVGGSPVVAILDEVGQIVGPQDPFVNAIITSQGAYSSPLLIAISTQSPTDADLFSQWLDDAKKSQDKKTVAHVYTSDPLADVLDRQAWKDSNPALGLFRSEEELAGEAGRAARMPAAENNFRNYYLNQRVSTVSNLVSKSVWAACSGEPGILYPGTIVWCGLDLSQRTDLTSMAVVFSSNGLWHVHSFYWTPEDGIRERSKRDRTPYDLWAKQGLIKTTPGKTVDYAFVARDVAEILKELEVKAIAYDRWRIEEFRRELISIGFDLQDTQDSRGILIEHGQGFKDMAPSIDNIECELLNGRVLHGGNPVLTMCASNAVVLKDAAGNRKLDKAKSTGRIDGFVALTMALGRAMVQPQEEQPQISFWADM